MIPARGLVRETVRNNPDVMMWILGIITPAVVYEIVAMLIFEGKLLSHGYARAAKRHPVLVRVILAVTVLHLEDLIDPRFDMYQGFGYVRPTRLLRNLRHGAR